MFRSDRDYKMEDLSFIKFSSNPLSHPGAKPKVKEDDFEDLIQGFASRPDKKGPRTIAEMRRDEMARDTDPLKLKVTDGTSAFRTRVKNSRPAGKCCPARPESSNFNQQI